MDAILRAEYRAREDQNFAALLTEMLASLEYHIGFDLGRLCETSYDDFDILLGVLHCWRLQRYSRAVLPEFRGVPVSDEVLSRTPGSK